MDDLPIPDGMNRDNKTSNDTLNDFALTATFEYGCDQNGWVIEIPGVYPEHMDVTCTEPPGYPSNWYYNIWLDGVWTNQVSSSKP